MMASIGEVVESVRRGHPSVCWRPDPEFENVCINALGHSGPCGWERNAGPCGDVIRGFNGQDMACTLKHGHTGAHQSDEGTMWTLVDD